MARTTKPLTNTEVQHAKPKDKVYTLSDGGGLQLKVKPNGSKLWLFDYYKPYIKKRTNMSFGPYPTLSIAEARKKRDAAKVLLAQDIDPKEHRDEEERINKTAHNNTLQAVALQWLEVKKSKITSDHATDTLRSLERHIFPELGKLPLHKITAAKTIKVIEPIAAKGSLETVKRLCQRLNEIMIYAVNTGVIDSNRLAGIRQAFQSPVKQHLPTLKPEQLPTLMKALSLASIKRTTRCLIEWQLHTIVRPSEAAGTRWDEIDFDNYLWIIPAKRMKKKKPHTVPLSSQCMDLLEVMQPISANREFVFPSDRNPRTHINAQTANMALKRMGFDKQLVAHGLRALASTTLNEQGFDSDVIEATLAHVGNNQVRNAYNRADYIKRRTPVMKWWSNHIEQAAIGNMSLGGSKGLKVVGGKSNG
jgi:integrase